jgi:hypothetical protein
MNIDKKNCWKVCAVSHVGKPDCVLFHTDFTLYKKGTFSGVDMIMTGKNHEKFGAVLAQKTALAILALSVMANIYKYLQKVAVINGRAKYVDRYYSAHSSEPRI